MDTQVLYPKNETFIDHEKVIARSEPKSIARLLFVDNLRIFLTILVILHHTMNIYANSGGWIYIEGRQDMITALLGKWFTVINQSYFMGLFILIAAYFVPGAYDRKGPACFIKDRLVRLGIPLVVYGLLIRPIFIYAGTAFSSEVSLSFIQWYTHDYIKEYTLIGGGPLWFISALLIFSITYALLRMLLPAWNPGPAGESTFPTNRRIAMLAVLIAIFAFIVRLWYPSDKVFAPLAFQLADFPQYIALFVVGIAAYHRDWLTHLPEKIGRLWMKLAIGGILLWPPMVLVLGGLENATPFKGGLHWQSALAATWQSFMGIAMCITVIHIFKSRGNMQSAAGRFFSRNAYTAYLSHEVVITFAALFIAGVLIHPLLKFALVALVTVPLTFGISALIRKLPFTQRVL